MALAALPFNPVTPPPEIQPNTSNFKTVYDFTDQFLPDLSKEMYLIRNREALHGWLAAHGMEESLTADKHTWAEEGERHVIHEGDVTRAGTTFTRASHSIRPDVKIEIYDPVAKIRVLALVTSVPDANSFVAVPYKYADFTAAGIGTTGLTVITAGSEYAKGTDGQTTALNNEFDIYENKPIIEKDVYKINNSDLTNISWFSYKGNFYWFDAQFEETYERFLDECEYSMLTAEKADATSPLFGTGTNGTEGYFSALRTRGATFNGLIQTTADIESIIKLQDRVHGETMNALFVSRDQSFKIDNWLSQLNANFSGGFDYGMWQNANINTDLVKLGFRGFEWAEYRFMKQTWNVLTNPTKGGANSLVVDGRVNGVMFPMGFTNLRETFGAENAKRVPYLTLMYKEMPGYSRRMEKFYLGSGRIAATNSNDSTEMHLRTERMLRVVGARKHLLIEN